MSRGDVIEIERRDDEGEWTPFGRLPIIQANKTKSREVTEGSSESSAEHVTFRVRWHKPLEDIEFDKACFRIRWRGQLFAIEGYDDFMFCHETVDLQAVSYRG